jgi:hypothetical protein
MPIGGFGTSSTRREEQYFVLPQNRTREPHSDPGGWRVAKGFNASSANTVSTHNTKQAAESRAKELARKNNTVLEIFDSALKSSRRSDFR